MNHDEGRRWAILIFIRDEYSKVIVSLVCVRLCLGPPHVEPKNHFGDLL